MTTITNAAALCGLNAAEMLLAQGDISGAWNGALAALKIRPYHPEAFRLMEKIALAAGDLETSQRCAATALQMAPARQAHQSSPAGELPKISPAWAGAGYALPLHKSPSISVCLIVKNEEAFLGRCLQSVRAAASQIVVVDTGSTDKTIDIAREHGAEVHHFKWRDDFSAARNAALAHASGDWILILDADEEFAPGSLERLRNEVKNPAAIGYVMPLIDDGKEHEGASYVPRLFRNFPGAFYEGRVHEQVFPIVQQRGLEWGLEILTSEAVLLHHGYTEELHAARNKSERNLRLLRQAALEQPEDPNILLNLGLENARAGNLAEGLEYYRQSLEKANRAIKKGACLSQEFRAALLQQMATYLTRAKDFAGVVELFKSPLALKGELSASDHYALGLARGQIGQFEEAAQQFRHCLAKCHLPSRIPVKANITGPQPHCCLAAVLSQLNRPADAEKAYQTALSLFGDSVEVRLPYAQFKHAQGRFIDALKDLHQLLQNHAANPDVWVTGGEICLANPNLYEIAKDWTGEALRIHPCDARIIEQRGEILLLSQETDEALKLPRTLRENLGARWLATSVLRELLSGTATPKPVALEIEAEASAMFVSLYRRLANAGCDQVLQQVKARLTDVRQCLPKAAQLLEADSQ